MKTQTKLIAAAAVALAALQAQAASTDWGAHDPVEIGANMVDPGIFVDSFEFSLANAASLVASAVSNNLGEGFGISGGTVRLFKVEPGPDTLIGSFGFDGTTGSTLNSFASLLAGDYRYRVSGLATGNAGGWYSIASAYSTVSAVPEMSTGALMAAGLGGMLLLASRRRHLGRDR